VSGLAKNPYRCEHVVYVQKPKKTRRYVIVNGTRTYTKPNAYYLYTEFVYEYTGRTTDTKRMVSRVRLLTKGDDGKPVILRLFGTENKRTRGRFREPFVVAWTPETATIGLLSIRYAATATISRRSCLSRSWNGRERVSVRTYYAYDSTKFDYTDRINWRTHPGDRFRGITRGSRARHTRSLGRTIRPRDAFNRIFPRTRLSSQTVFVFTCVRGTRSLHR